MLRLCCLTLTAAFLLAGAPKPPREHHRVTQGSLLAVDPRGGMEMECPLKHTDVKADVTGFLARVNVTQEFENTAPGKIEAVYVFPLPQNSAVDDMTLTVGDRVVKGLIKRREEARAIYEAARNSGRLAGLLDQERPNIFTQSVANIAPGAKVKITISYVEHLKYEGGFYEFMFPMVVGPRYIRNEGLVPDADRISPPVSPTRAAHDLSLEVKLDAGLPLQSVASSTHDVAVERSGANRAVIHLRETSTIPNKDFLLRFEASGKKIQNTVIAHRGQNGGFFSLIVQPPERVHAGEATPKEIVFVLDTSGSMSGFPIEKAKESMRYALDGLNPSDTFNLITFSGDTAILFPKPVPATPENLTLAKEFIAGRYGSGGTEMMKAVRAALEGTEDQKHVRIACFMTDGYVGFEDQIIAEIQKHPNARVFSFGIGSAVNRYLLDKMAEQGRGEVEYVGLQDDGSAAARRFAERVRNPLLTDIRVDWGSLPVSEVYPAKIPDLFSSKPLVLTGRYAGSAKGTVRVGGRMDGRTVTMDVPVELPAAEPQHAVLATLWARRKVDSLLMNGGNAREEITKLGLDYRLMTAYTSFVAVEETTVIDGGKPRTVQVPVEIPDGVSYEGIFGEAPGLQFAGMKSRMAYATPAFVSSTAQAVEVRPSPAPMPVQDARLKIAPALANRTGRLEIRIYLKSTSAQTLAALKQAGFELIAQPASAKVVVGRIDASRLKGLSELPDVIHIAPLLN